MTWRKRAGSKRTAVSTTRRADARRGRANLGLDEAEVGDRVALLLELEDALVDPLAREVGDVEALDDRPIATAATAGVTADDALGDPVGTVARNAHRNPVTVRRAEHPVVDVVDRGVGRRGGAGGTAGVDDLGAAFADPRDVFVGDPGLVVDLITSQPGISASDVAKTMKIKPNYLYRVLGDLEKEGRVKKDGRNYFPAG